MLYQCASSETEKAKIKTSAKMIVTSVSMPTPPVNPISLFLTPYGGGGTKIGQCRKGRKIGNLLAEVAESKSVGRSDGGIGGVEHK